MRSECIVDGAIEASVDKSAGDKAAVVGESHVEIGIGAVEGEEVEWGWGWGFGDAALRGGSVGGLLWGGGDSGSGPYVKAVVSNGRVRLTLEASNSETN